MLVYLFLWYVILIPWARRSLPLAEDMDQKEIHTRINFFHSRFPHCQTQSQPLESEDAPSTSEKLNACQILLKIERKIALSAGCRINDMMTHIQ
jgi:hypothetical protein